MPKRSQLLPFINRCSVYYDQQVTNAWQLIWFGL